MERNPISNASTAAGLVIDRMLVEDNVDPATGKAAADHLEIALSNTSGIELKRFEIFYTLTKPITGVSEGYYTALPSGFTVIAGAKRIVHFDGSGLPDHFPVNAFSLYYTDTSSLDVRVEVSATNAKVQSAQITKDAGGAEAAD